MDGKTFPTGSCLASLHSAKSLLKGTVWHHQACEVMLTSNQKELFFFFFFLWGGGGFYLHHKPVKDTFSCTPFALQCLILKKYLLKCII